MTYVTCACGWHGTISEMDTDTGDDDPRSPIFYPACDSR